MIDTKEIWRKIERYGWSSWVSRYEKWATQRECKEIIHKKKIVAWINADRFFYFMLSLLTIVFISSIIFIFIQRRVLYGIVILIIDLLFIRDLFYKRYTGYTYLFEDGILNGLYFKTIIKSLKVVCTFLEYEFIKEIYIESHKRNPKLIVITIKTIDGKEWPYSKDYSGIALPKKHPKTEAIVSYLRKISKERNILFIDNRAYSG